MDDLFDICIEAPLTCNEHIFLCWLHSIPIHKTCDYIINNNDHFTKQNQQNNSTSIKNAKSMNSESVDREQGAVSIDNEPNDTNRKNINNELDDNMSSANANTSDNIAYPHLLFRCHNRLTHNNMYMATHDSETNTNINQNKRALPLSSTLNKQLLTLEIKDHYKCYNLFEYYLQRPSLLIQITIGKCDESADIVTIEPYGIFIYNVCCRQHICSIRYSIHVYKHDF